MKKYLIKGALALFGGALLFSCAEKETEFVPLAQQKAQAFEDVFKEVYGDIDPYQDWGFSSGKVEIDENDSSQIVEVIDVNGDIAVTRAVPFGGMSRLLAFNTGGTRTANTEKNLWGDPNYYNLNVPPALTEGQKLRVKLYFQAHPNLTYVDPHYTNFFVQQVYKGNPNTAGTNSPEQYQQTNENWVVGSENMDWLYVGRNNDHVNDFNDGDYNNGQTIQVLNTGASTNDYTTQSHPDQITYMVNSSTEYVAYGSSTASIKHTNCCALASAAEIDAWATANNIGGDPVVDGWNRSFVGLDYENGTLESLYSTDKGNAKALDFCDANYILYNGHIYEKNSFTDFELATLAGIKAHYLTDNVSNQGIANYIKDSSNNNVTKSTYNYNLSRSTFSSYGITITNDEDRVYNLDMVIGYVNQGALPTNNNGNWVIYTGGRDYVYSDWIVTLTPAGGAPQPSYQYPEERIDEWWQIERGRVFCEDLGVASREDLDYNDVVFDAIIFKNRYKFTKWKEKWVNNVCVSSEVIESVPEQIKYYANVEILAAGGTIPITVADLPVHDQFVPKADLVSMVNTRDNNSTAFGSYVERDPVQLGSIHKIFTLKDDENEKFDVMLYEIDQPEDGKFINSIKIVSSFGEAQICELVGKRGEAPRKFMAPIGTRWTSERKNISLAYPGFDAWVKGGDAPWSNVNINYIYDKDLHSNSMKLPLVMKARQRVNTEGEQDLWSGSKEYGNNWSLADMNATLDLDQFYPGDRLRFYGENILDEAWITVVIGDITPYFIDSEFPNYYIDSDGKKVSRSNGCVEVLLDEDSAKLLNSKVSDGKVTFQVQGRNFTLTRICRVLFQ